MLKLFVVDDESWVRQGLRTTIDWTTYGIEWSGEADNGEEALRLITANVPDIILTDIKMPSMDGLVFMEEMKKTGISAKVIFISGYNDFAYAQKAIQLGAFDYILKPVEETILIDIMQRCVDEILTEKKKLEQTRQLSGRIRESLPLARQRFLELCLLEGQVPQIEVKWEALNIDLNPNRLLVATATVHEWRTEELDESGFSLIRFGLGNIAEELYIAAGISCISCPLHQHDVVDLAVILSPPAPYAIADVAEFARKWILEADRVLGLKISVGISSPLPRRDLSHAFKEAVSNTANSFYSGFGGCHLTVEQPGSEAKSIQASMDPAWSNRVVFALKLSDYRQLNDLLDEQIHYLNSLKGNLSALTVRQNVNLLMQSILTKWEEILAQIQASDKRSLTYEQTMRLYRFVLPHMKDVFFSVFYIAGAGALSNPKHTIQLALEYIHRHYQTNIGLNDVAARLYMNPSYFSRVFHEEMAETFSKYIVRLRMKKAKELLKQTPLRIYEVADKIGYKDFRHFVKTFKETEGVSPAEFRNSGI